MNIDYTAREVADAYVDMTQNVVRTFEIFLQDMEQRCRRHGYEPMVNFVNAMQKFYQEDLYQHVQNAYRDWENSDYSLERLARRLNAGTGAEATGRRYMHEVEDAIRQMFRLTLGDIRVDTDAPAVSERDIEEIGDEITNFIRQAEQEKERVVSYVNSQASDNLLFACTKPIIISTGESLVESFRTMIIEVLSAADLFQNYTTFVHDMVGQFRTREVSVSVGWPSDVPFM